MEHPVEAGQVYLHRRLNEYVVVVRNNGGVVLFAGYGIVGKMDEYMFLKRMPPVDPTDVDAVDAERLMAFYPELVTGYQGEIVCTL